MGLINLYDGNNVMRRALERKSIMPGERRMGLRLRYEQTTPGDIWCWDGHQHNERRRDIYPLYKMNRTPVAEDIFAQTRLWKELLTMTPATQITVHGWEADDLIGTLVRKYPGRFRVHTNDQDYGQVAHLCELNGVNMKGVPPRWIALYKALNGDSSDNIKGIPGFGTKRWVEMEPHWKTIQDAIVTGRPEAFVDLPFKPAVKAWLMDDEHIKLLQDMLTITHFMNVPDDEITGGLSVGKLDRRAADLRLRDFFL